MCVAMPCSTVAAPGTAVPVAGGVADSREPLGEPALLEVFNRPVLVLRASSFGTSPAGRARRISERIDLMLEKHVYGPVKSEGRTEGVLITIGGELAFLVLQGDVDSLAGMTLETTVEQVVHQLTAALGEARLQNSTSYVMTAAGKAFGATALYVAALSLVLVVRRRVVPRIRKLEMRIVRQLHERGMIYLVKLVQVIRWSLNLASWGLVLFLTFAWMSICLHWFPYTRPWGDGLQANLWRGISGMFHSLLATLPNLLVIAVIVVLARGVVGIVRNFFTGIESGDVKVDWMDLEAARATRRILTILVWLFAVVMIYPYIPGSDSGAFKGMSVFIGLILSLGSSSVMGQFTSGLVLMYSRALKPGEFVRIGDHEGVVETLGFLSTKIRSPKNEEFHVPNTLILSTTVKNYSRLAEEGGLLLHTTVTIGYDSPWRQVHALLIAAAKNTPGLALEPSPFVLQKALSDFYVEYELNARLLEPQKRPYVLAALHANIQDQFNAHGVQIMSPHYMQDKVQPVVVPPEKWFQPPATSGGAGEGGLIPKA